MSYTKALTSLASKAGILSLRISPSTRIDGGVPVDKCKSDALCCTLNASSSVISIKASFIR